MKNQKPNIVAIDINAVKSRMLEVRGQPVLLDGGVSATGARQFTAPGWVCDANGALRRETIHHMGRRLPDFDYSSRRIYEITVVLEERRAVLGRLEKTSAALSGHWLDRGDGESGQGWAVEPSAWGAVVLGCWREGLGRFLIRRYSGLSWPFNFGQMMDALKRDWYG